jgi:hypothetical protein
MASGCAYVGEEETGCSLEIRVYRIVNKRATMEIRTLTKKNVSFVDDHPVNVFQS